MNPLAPASGWYMARTVRERWLIGIMLAVAIPLLCFLLIYRPLTAAIERAEERHSVAVRNHALVLARLAQLDTVQRPAVALPAGSAPLSLRVTEAAALAGVSLSANEPRGNSSALITLAPSAPTAALRWLRQLEQQGIVVRELTITPQQGGQVVVTATLTQAGAQ
ncbi:type II secretion system protein GspM [Sphingomonas glaciei]|uniref:Type II secretion system protein M n=1 Tax=Sphingomonas glaciei TaxID=2938948 RepID=A0ABY5MWL6_9SPHN|nr:type II secretion system protein GspM [Sphingomonas glaciei]UUR08369.1 type II secretion system protein M [Sphingomonas glaciei]